MPNNMLLGRCCCGDAGCDGPGVFYDDFSLERSGWTPFGYWNLVVDQVNDRVDVLTFGDIAYQPLTRCVQSGGFRDGWSIEFMADVYVGIPSLSTRAGIFISADSGSAFIRIESGDVSTRASYGASDIDGTTGGSFATTTSATHELKLVVAWADGPIGTVDVAFYFDTVLKATFEKFFQISTQMIYGLQGTAIPVPVNPDPVTWFDDVNMTLSVPAAGPGGENESAKAPQRMLPIWNQLHGPPGSGLPRYTRNLIPAMNSR